MKVALLQIEDKQHPNVYGDFAGGFGAGFEPGKNILARAVGFAKHYGLDLPLLNFGYLATIITQAGHLIEAGRNCTTDAELIIIQSSLTGWKQQLEYAQEVKQRAKQRVGFIGPLASTLSEQFLEHSDFVIVGEPEAAAYRLVQGEMLTGLVESPPIRDLDSIPFPTWDPFDFVRFSYFPSLVKKPIFPILASRGCPEKCTYCPYKVQFKKFRARSVENIVTEMKLLIREKGAAGFLFRDPYFSFSKKRTERFAKMLIEEKVNTPWVCETKLDSLDKELILLLKEAGLKTINVGIESVKPEILQKAGRTVFDQQQVYELIDFCDLQGVKVAGFFILGWPDDTPDSIEATIRFALSLNLHIATFTLFTPFPGTPVFDELKDSIFTQDWSQFDVMSSVYHHPAFSSDELLALKESAYLRFYYRPKYIFSFVRRLLRS